MQIIETFSHGKRDNEALNEDAIFSNDHYIAVIDGVTNKSHNNMWAPSPGVQARKTITFALNHAESNFSAKEMYDFLNECLKTRYTDINFFREHPNDRLAVNCIIYSVAKKEIWFFGDCHCLVDNKYYSNIKQIDVILAELRSFVYSATQFKKVIPMEKDPGRQAILPFLELQANLANTNTEYGYLVLDGIGNLPEKIKIISVSTAHTIILASDGYPLLKDNLSDSENALKKLKLQDPMLISTYKATKSFSPRLDSFDDRSYIKFSI